MSKNECNSFPASHLPETLKLVSRDLIELTFYFRLRSLPVHIRFVTNTTKESRHSLTHRLTKTIGFQIEQQEIYSSLSAAVDYVKEHKLNPFYLLSKDARKDFPEATSSDHDSVVVGLAPDEFHYENLNRAFNILRSKPRLIAIHEGKYLKREDGLVIGPGFFTKGLEYSAGLQSTVVGKPNQYFFRAAIPEGCEAGNCVMIGDVSDSRLFHPLQIY